MTEDERKLRRSLLRFIGRAWQASARRVAEREARGEMFARINRRMLREEALEAKASEAAAVAAFHARCSQ